MGPKAFLRGPPNAFSRDMFSNVARTCHHTKQGAQGTFCGPRKRGYCVTRDESVVKPLGISFLSIGLVDDLISLARKSDSRVVILEFCSTFCNFSSTSSQTYIINARALEAVIACIPLEQGSQGMCLGCWLSFTFTFLHRAMVGHETNFKLAMLGCFGQCKVSPCPELGVFWAGQSVPTPGTRGVFGSAKGPHAQN